MTKSISERIQEVEQEQSEFLANLPPFLKFSEGVNTLQIVSDQVEEGKYGTHYQAVLNGKTGILSLKGILEREILAQLKSGFNTMRVIRVGTGLDTRYKVERA
jgi:hypothetical protein